MLGWDGIWCCQGFVRELDMPINPIVGEEEKRRLRLTRTRVKHLIGHACWRWVPIPLEYSSASYLEYSCSTGILEKHLLNFISSLFVTLGLICAMSLLCLQLPHNCYIRIPSQLNLKRRNLIPTIVLVTVTHYVPPIYSTVITYFTSNASFGRQKLNTHQRKKKWKSICLRMQRITANIRNNCKHVGLSCSALFIPISNWIQETTK